jgi:signal transduction histidine kinase
VDYITKPFQFQEVVARIETHLSLRLLQRKLQHTVQELSHANQALVASNKELDAFGRTVAHDLKNPLGIILAYLELLQQDLTSNPTITESTREMMDNIQRAAARSVNIVDELLLLAGVRKSKVNLKPMDMAQVVAQVQQRLAPLFAQHQVELILPESWPTALGHAPWLEEVWMNYLTNGLKYGGTPPRLELGASIQADQTVRFWVRDNGPGLTLEEQEIIFTEFTRLNEWRVEGHGLGLSIVKRIIEKLNGQVGVNSQVGQGSVFYFILPQVESSDILQVTQGVNHGN